MNKTFDVLIVGGGVIGCSVAYHLSCRGLRVGLVDKGLLGRRSSWGPPGMLAAQEEAAEPGPFLDFCVESRELFKSLAPAVQAEAGLDPEYETAGVWRVAETPAERNQLLARQAWHLQRGLRAEWISSDELGRRMPVLAQPFEGALYFPDDGQISSRLWVEALAKASARRGAIIMESAGAVELLTEKGRVLGLRAGSEDMPAGAVVASAGVWTSEFLAPWVSFPLTPVKGQLITLRGTPRLLPAPVFAGGGYVAPKRDGRWIVGATQEQAGFDERVTLDAVRFLGARAARWFPAAASWEVAGLWAGLRPDTPDHWPLMGAVPGVENLFICAGHFRNGVLLSPLSGAIMAAGIVDRRWPASSEYFAPGRFATPAGVAWS